MKKPHSRPETNWRSGISLMKGALFIGLAFCLLVLFAMIQKDWGRAVTLSCILYTVAVSFFFIAQLFGFILSQTEYSEAVELPKFQMLEAEEKEWKV